MPALQALLVLLQKALPALAKQLPKLWPLLLETKNREKLMSLGRDLASTSPKRKLAARMEATELLAEAVAEKAEADNERSRASDWQKRARKMRVRLDMPVEGAKARRTHRKTLHEDLRELHEEMSQALRG